MLAYRLENDRRKGPFTEHGISHMDPERYRFLPNPREEHLEMRRSDLCAAPSIHMLRRWFPKKMRRYCHEHGFRIVVIKTTSRPRKVGKFQVLVDVDDPIVGTLCPETLTLH